MLYMLSIFFTIPSRLRCWRLIAWKCQELRHFCLVCCMQFGQIWILSIKFPPFWYTVYIIHPVEEDLGEWRSDFCRSQTWPNSTSRSRSLSWSRLAASFFRYLPRKNLMCFSALKKKPRPHHFHGEADTENIQNLAQGFTTRTWGTEPGTFWRKIIAIFCLKTFL